MKSMKATQVRMVAAAPATVKPLIKRPPGCRYKTVLSIDGGGIKGIIPATVLKSLESTIKDHILENSSTLIPAEYRQSISSTKDFNVDLTDYFDLVAGTSIGSWIALYIAGRGKGSDALFKDPKMSESEYEDLRPGSMETIQAVFQKYGSEVFPDPGPFATIGRLLHALYPSKGLESVLEKVFGNATFKDLETGCLITSFDLEKNVACSFLRDVGPRQTAYTVSSAVRETPRASTDGAGGGKSDEEWKPDLDIKEDTNYLLRDIAHASSAAPTFFEPAKITRLNGTGEVMTMVDGGMVANNPTLQALTYAPEFFNSDIRDIAVFSVGCGTTDPEKSRRQNPGAGWWLLSGYLVDIMQEGTGEYIQGVMDYWLYRLVRLPYGQYVRIQRKAVPESEDGKLVANMDKVDNLMDLQRLGERMAKTNGTAIKKFVRDFIFYA